MKKIINKTLSLGLAVIFILLALMSCDPTTDQAEQNGGNNNYVSIEVLKSDSDLVIKLIEYCNFLINPPNWDLPSVSLEQLINTMRGGVIRPLLVDYEAGNCYYVCGYYNCDEHRPEQREYYCASNYTWVKYENVKDIRDNYDGKSFVVAFQINRPSITKNILTGDEKSQSMEIVGTYTPEFVEGTNIGEIDSFDKTVIFLTSDKESVIYRIYTAPHSLYEIDCVRLDNKYYISFEMYSVSDSGMRYDYDQSWNFGEYYDSMMDIMITEKYSKELDSGSVIHYGLVDIDEFVNEIIEKQEK